MMQKINKFTENSRPLDDDILQDICVRYDRNPHTEVISIINLLTTLYTVLILFEREVVSLR